MKNQDTEAKLATAKEEIEKLRSENHNLKRKVKRMEARKESDRAERQKERIFPKTCQTGEDTRICSLKS